MTLQTSTVDFSSLQTPVAKLKRGLKRQRDIDIIGRTPVRLYALSLVQYSRVFEHLFNNLIFWKSQTDCFPIENENRGVAFYTLGFCWRSGSQTLASGQVDSTWMVPLTGYSCGDWFIWRGWECIKVCLVWRNTFTLQSADFNWVAKCSWEKVCAVFGQLGFGNVINSVWANCANQNHWRKIVDSLFFEVDYSLIIPVRHPCCLWLID